MDTQASIAALYRQVLEVDDVSADDDFFVLGGNSLLAMRLLELIEQELGVKIPARAFYQGTTVAELSDTVQESLQEVAR
uniref:Long-chain-fatty-acid--CoA ligase n=1 Tax=uncultured bacterium esnapd17 TaxID=1366598 RepID=S5TLH4_9BACT|nr:long-chain-fatty-acid--CoA ligase [uncultured bacterium esnapd17]